jgi:hypothetical protein
MKGLAEPLRVHEVVVVTKERVYRIDGYSGAATWDAELPVFRAMIASFRLPADE